jgi:hypothetical protein
MRSDTSEPRLVPKRILDPSTGEADVNYDWDGRLVPKIPITGRLIDQLSGYSLIKKDLDSALRWVGSAKKIASTHPNWGQLGYFHATDRESFDLVKAYFVASLAFYGKCFTEAAGRHAQVSRDWLDTNYRTVHDEVMKYRHNLAAHSGDERIENTKTYVLLKPDRTAFLPFLPTARFQPDVIFPSEAELGFEELIKHVGAKVAERYDKVAQKIIGECIIPAGVSFWAAAAEKGDPVPLSVGRKR